VLFTRQSNKPFDPVHQKKTKTNCEHFSLTYFAKKGRNFDDLIAYFDLFLFDFEIFKVSKFNVPRVREHSRQTSGFAIIIYAYTWFRELYIDSSN
jgi:hypothetical protein